MGRILVVKVLGWYGDWVVVVVLELCVVLLSDDIDFFVVVVNVLVVIGEFVKEVILVMIDWMKLWFYYEDCLFVVCDYSEVLGVMGKFVVFDLIDVLDMLD